MYKWLHEESETCHKTTVEFLERLNKYNIDPNAEEFARGWWARPIPITVEWLLKLGFEKKSQGQYYISRQEELGHDFGDFSISVYDQTQIKVWRGNRYIGVVSCAYIHQLQNLYYALTGEELKYQK